MDCGCGGGSNCITKHKKEFKKWVKAELKRLDCGCGCKGQKAFEEKYGKLVGGKLTACPEGWRDDGLTCVKNCKDGEKDDGLTCRAKCEKGDIDDGLTCRKPITSSMNDCPPGSKDIWGTCWGPVRRDCVHDCFKHPAPGCKTWQCGRLEWAGIDWGPKLCTSCNLECGKTCWDVWGITKQLHERQLQVHGGQVTGKAIYGKEIRSKVDWQATEKEIQNAFKEAFGNDSALAKAFDPEKNGVAESFRKFGKNTKEAFDDIGRKLKEGFEKAMTPEFRKWLERHKKAWTTAFRFFFPPNLIELLNDPSFWIEVAISLAEIAAVIIAGSATIATMGAAAPVTTAILVTALNMIGPSMRMIVKASKGEPIGANDISSLVLSAIPPAGKNATAASSYLGKLFQFIQRNKDTLGYGAWILTQGIDFAYDAGYSSVSTCLVNCPTRDDRPFPPEDNPNPIYIPPMDPPPPGQKTDAELLAMAPGNKPFVKFLTDGPEVNPDYIKMTPLKWIKKKRRELYNYPPPTDTTGPAGNLETPQDQQIQAVTEIPKNETPEFIQPVRTAEEEALLAGFGRFRGGAIENQPLIEAEVVDGEYVNPMGNLTSRPEFSGKEPPKGPGGCEFNPKCYAQNYPDLFNALERDEKEMSAYWTDVGKAQGHNPCCGARLEIGKNYEEEHVKCNARNAFYDRGSRICDISRNTKGIKKTTLQFRQDDCKAQGNYWGGETYITEERTQPDFLTGKYEIRRTEHTKPGTLRCDPSRNIDGKNKVEEAAKQQAEANKKTIDRIVKDDFFPDCYAANNPDVVAKVGNTNEALEKHFREFGIDQQRSSKCGEDLKHLKEASNKAKALEEFNAYCYAYNNPEVFKEVGKSYFEKVGTLQREQPAVLEQRLKQHFSDVGYAKRLDYSCAPRDSEYNWECFAENMRTIKNAAFAGVNFNNEATVNRLWDSQKNGSWEYFDKGACKQTNLRKAKEIRLFNAKCYAFNNPELILKFGKDDAAYLKHFIDEGFDQGLDTSCDVRNQTFKPECYGFANPDLNTTDVAALTNHWNSNGKNEWRGINCTPDQAETVFQKQYCQDTDSFWDGANCDLNRHTNGTSKEQISNDAIEAYLNLFPENERDTVRENFRQQGMEAWKYAAAQANEQCINSNSFLDIGNSAYQRPYGLPCNPTRTPDGRYKKDICHEQNKYYDEVTHLCDANRTPSGKTHEEHEKFVKEEGIRLMKEEYECNLADKYWTGAICDASRKKDGELRAQYDCRMRNSFWDGAKCHEDIDVNNRWKKSIEERCAEQGLSVVRDPITKEDVCGNEKAIKNSNLYAILDAQKQAHGNNLPKWNEKRELYMDAINKNLWTQANHNNYAIGDLVFFNRFGGISLDYRDYEPYEKISNNPRKQGEDANPQEDSNWLRSWKGATNIDEWLTFPAPKMFKHDINIDEVEIPENIEQWNIMNQYKAGDFVIFHEFIYKAIGNNSGFFPHDSPTKWVKIMEVPLKSNKLEDNPNYKGLWMEADDNIYTRAGLIVISPIDGKTYISKDFINRRLVDPSKNHEWELYIHPDSNEQITEIIPEEVPEEQIPERVLEVKEPEPYNDSKVYQLGDVVTKDGITYKMIDGIGLPGYPPPRPTNWQPVITGSSKPASLTLYWAEWCPHCHDLLPVWQKLGKMHKGIKIQALEEKQTDFQVDGYPTIIFRNGRNMEKYEGKRNKNAILNFLKNKLSKK